MHMIPKWFSKMTKREIQCFFQEQHAEVRQRHHQPLVNFAGYKNRTFFFDLNSGGSYMSLAEENAINEEDLPRLWKEVEIADEKEMGQFVDEHAFEKIKSADVPDGAIIIDGIWIRCWKLKQNQWILKSRMLLQ